MSFILFTALLVSEQSFFNPNAVVCVEVVEPFYY